MITYYALGTEGRLGNQLWEIASTLGIAAVRDEDVRFPVWDYQPWFSVPAYLFGEPEGVDATTFALSIPVNHRPYLQDVKLWWRIRQTINQYFQPSVIATQMIGDRYADLLQSNRPLTAVHVRRTDAVAKQQWFKLPDLEYYCSAMELVAQRGPTKFLVFSDDIDWCYEHFPSIVEGNDVKFVTDVLPDPGRSPRGDPLGNEDDWWEFFLMRACSNHITSNSTFSWWAAYLSGDPTPITPAVWYGPKYVDEIDLDNFIFPNWIRL